MVDTEPSDGKLTREEFQREVLKLLDEGGKQALDDMQNSLRLDKQDRTQLAAACIYASVVELYYGCLALIHEKQWTALPVVLRSMLESYADLRALSRDSGYWKHLHANNLDQLIRLANKADPKHRFLGALFTAGDVEARKKELKAELDRARKSGYGPIQNWQRFEKAQLGPEYDSIYWVLCGEGHNGLSTLEERHLVYEGEEYHVVAFRQDGSDARAYLDALLVTLIDSSGCIHSMLNTGAAQRYRDLAQRYDALRARVPK